MSLTCARKQKFWILPLVFFDWVVLPKVPVKFAYIASSVSSLCTLRVKASNWSFFLEHMSWHCMVLNRYKETKCRKIPNYSHCSWFQSTSDSLCIMLTWKHQMGASCEIEHLFVVEPVFMQMIVVVKAPWCRVVLFTFTFSPKD